MTRWIQIVMLCLGLSLPLAGQSASFSQADRPERKPWSADRLAAFNQDRADSLTGFDVQKYEITLSINDQSHVITGNVLATVLAEQSLSSLQYELRSLTVSSVLVNGSPAAYTHTNGVITISLNIPAGQTFTTQVFYSGVPQLTSDIYHIGMIFSANTVFTISDPDAARQWWPCYDHPWDKALVDLHITMRSDWKVAANGLRDGITDHGNGSSTTHWLGQHPMTTYLVCVTAGPYVEIPQTAGTLPIMNFVMQNQYNNALIDFQHLPDMIQYFSQVFGPYPFEKYGQTVVSMSTYGAMEHQTMTTLGNYIITGNGIYEVVIAHELAHQWYGNAVSFLTFKDVWLSEGFATYSEHLWTDKRFGWDSACAYVGSSYHQYYNNWENSAGPQTIYNPSFNNYFAPPSYEKAASVLHMLRLKIGNANFFALLNQWFTAHMHGNVITSEFQALAEQISGQDLDQFFNQWIFGSGIPSLEYSIWNNDMSDSPGKIIARSTSPTATSFQIEVPFRVTVSGISDSLYVEAGPDWTVNHYFQSLPPDLSVIANHNHWTLLRQTTEIRPLLTECLPSNNSVLLAWQSFMDDPSLRYNIYRRVAGSQAWTLVNQTPIQGLSYSDTGAQNGVTYQYCIAALDLGGWQSIYSPWMSATPESFGFNYGLLVVDETRDGNGSNIGPDDAMVDSFYDAALQPITYAQWDVATQGMPPLNILGNYQLLLWHADDFSHNLLVDDTQTLSGYILGGGKVIISGWKTTAALNDEFFQRFAGGITPVYDNTAAFIGATSNSYPCITVDADKMMPAWNGMLPYMYTFQNPANSIYTANMTPTALGNGLSAMFRADQPVNGGVLVMSGFPLYFMHAAPVRSFLQMIIPQIAPNVASADSESPALSASMRAYPNPFNPSTTIEFFLPKAGRAQLSLYNVKGQLVKRLLDQEQPRGAQQIVFDGVTEEGTPLPSGTYILRLNCGPVGLTRLITLMK
ncbi:MAG TPA: M1 family aminopeptidase [Candidatus Cloacimonadota bacterium]|nr:M1 family aminopeptidase [Candidatus Cloacimonadota bacterium]